jgi:hypothetical protein
MNSWDWSSSSVIGEREPDIIVCQRTRHVQKREKNLKKRISTTTTANRKTTTKQKICGRGGIVEKSFFLVSFMRVSSMLSFLLLLFVLCPLVLFGCSAYRVSLYCCCPVQVGGGGGGGAQKDSRCTTTVVYYSSYSLVIETIQHVMSGPSSHSYNSPFCYVSLLCERASSSAVSSHPAPPLARVTKRMRNNTHTQHRSGRPHILYRRTQLHRFDIKRVFFCFFS